MRSIGRHQLRPVALGHRLDVRIIDQGASEISIMVGVEAADLGKGLRAVDDAFVRWASRQIGVRLEVDSAQEGAMDIAMAWASSTNPARVGTVRAGVDTLSAEASRTFLQRVHLFMSLGLAATGLVALAVVSSPSALAFVFGNALVFPALLIAELILVFAFAPVAARVSASTAAAMFFGYAALSGVTFSVIFLRYTAGSIGSTFLITGGMFAGLSIYGATTKRDLSSLGSFCMMGLVGIILASIVNIFLGSPMIYWLTTFAGVIVFTGLTAYDTAKLKELGAQAGEGEAHTKLALQGALVLYLDFINLFFMLLRIFGNRRRD